MLTSDALNAYFNWNNASPDFNSIMGFSDSSFVEQPNPEYDLVKSYDITEIRRMLCFPKQNNFGKYKQDENMNRNSTGNSTARYNSNWRKPNCQNTNGNSNRNQLTRNLRIQRNIGNNSARGRRKNKRITLVLDLDETLVHRKRLGSNSVSTGERPYLHYFLEKVADMFEVVVFTSSTREYASKVLDNLDPQGRIFSKRLYRDSCTYYVNGGWVKDPTVLGVDLARVAIIDNSSSMFQMQQENGIQIKSWYDDPDDDELAKLLPFLETLAKADDVRPLISKKIQNQHKFRTNILYKNF